MRAEVRISWREEIVDDERNFYVKLSPDVHYVVTDIEETKKQIVDKLLSDLEKTAKNVKVKK